MTYNNSKKEDFNDKVPERVKFEPIVATAIRLDDKGYETGEKEIIKIDISNDEDIHTYERAVKDFKIISKIKKDKNDNQDKNNTQNEKNIKINKQGEKDMDKEDVSFLLDEKLKEMQLLQNIDDIKKISEKLQERTNSMENTLSSKFESELKTVDDRLSNVSKRINENIENKIQNVLGKIDEQEQNILEKMNDREQTLMEKQTESCTGVECIKGSLKIITEKNEQLGNMIEVLDKRTKTATCSGETGCNEQIPIGSSYCPGCGKSIKKWKGIPEWIPHNERKH